MVHAGRRTKILASIYQTRATPKDDTKRLNLVVSDYFERVELAAGRARQGGASRRWESCATAI